MEFGGTAVSWHDEEVLKSTSDPNITAVTDELPMLTMTTIVGMTVVMIVAIAAVFILGVLIDCRQQRLIEEKINEAKRAKSQRRVNTHPGDDSASIVNNMEEGATSAPPADTLRHIP